MNTKSFSSRLCLKYLVRKFFIIHVLFSFTTGQLKRFYTNQSTVTSLLFVCHLFQFKRLISRIFLLNSRLTGKWINIWRSNSHSTTFSYVAYLTLTEQTHFNESRSYCLIPRISETGRISNLIGL